MKKLFLLIPFIWACNKTPQYNPERNYTDIEKDLTTRFILAEDSSTIELEAGHFIFGKSLILEGKSNIIIKGKGKDQTVLSFKDQKEGAEGIRIANCKNITLQDFAVEDAAGDNIKVTDTDGITFNGIKAAWTGEVTQENGAYGLYPVLCQNVLVEHCEVLGASDAGIYVGQSKDVTIQYNTVYWNVAGIESENSENVQIIANKAYDNTGGILVFDLPGLTRYGRKVKVYDNEVTNNNLKNFAPKGNIVAMVPPGTGLLILASRDVEVFANTIKDNKTVGAGIISYHLINAMGYENQPEQNQTAGMQSDFEKDKNYDPYPGNIYFHDNIFENSYSIPDMGNDFGKLFVLKFGTNLPDIVWDGIMHPDFYLDDNTVNPAFQICIQEQEGVKKVTLDAEHDFEGLEENPELFNCRGSI